MICIRSSKNRNKPNVCVVCVPSALYYLLCFYLSLSPFFYPSTPPCSLSLLGNARRRVVVSSMLPLEVAHSRERALGAGFSISLPPSPPPTSFPPRLPPMRLRVSLELCSILLRAQKRSSDPPHDTRLECIRVHETVRTRRALNSVWPRFNARQASRRNDIPSAYSLQIPTDGRTDGDAAGSVASISHVPHAESARSQRRTSRCCVFCSVFATASRSFDPWTAPPRP